MSQYFIYRDENGVLREIEGYVAGDFASTFAPNSPVITTEEGLIHPSLLPRERNIFKKEFITLTQANIDNKKFTLELIPIPNTISLLPPGGLPQIVDEDFIYESEDNSISWAGFDLEEYFEKDEVIEVSYYHIPAQRILFRREIVTLTQDHIANKKLPLDFTPVDRNISLTPAGGITQFIDSHFNLLPLENSITWSGYQIENYFEVGDVVEVTYFYDQEI